jgi:hypothetical protein
MVPARAFLADPTIAAAMRTSSTISVSKLIAAASFDR